ncbi:site-specific DNA-methyltransferase [Candidatus Woesearchaeota archaeon]|jgi:site-specific DNA-methyltransferase (adenine-specific)|nr:site-specific DNA-methyltransferase [Candidatus Woesearchaeota archaeon]MBT4732280.1 site-specific DNA-methyltransferase [Candidatus Woesearchaeota archaeon]MBT7555343.1 site-specific DNA-methyltransferase [Candidatus Woesearchaeota archaeon]
MKLYKGDCLEQHKHIKDGSVDLVLTDLPYGTVKGLGNSRVAKEKKYNVSEWDITIDTDQVMQIANRILRKNGKMILTANQPFTTELISKAIPNLPHSYNMYWDKMHFANCLVSNKAPVSYIEDVLVFSKKYDVENLHPLRTYFGNVLSFIGLKKKNVIEAIGQRADHVFRIKSSQFELCKKETYLALITEYRINNMDGFLNYSELEKINERHTSTFNLWEGNKYKSNILKYKKDYDGYHPTQKPVLLLEDLIKTFSNENDLVVDLTMGSGSTGVACMNTNRDFIGIELDENYFKIAEERIEKHTKQERLF